jgi:uncharacterized metal-binding protein
MKNTYTDNVKFNAMATPLIIGVYCYISFKWMTPSLKEGLIFVGIYLFCSTFFQPDLDVRGNRPGKKYFPLGQKLWNALSFDLGHLMPIGRNLLIMLFGPHVRSFPMLFFLIINRVWYYTWAPFTYLVTHRGISHWPVIGVWVRTLYLLFISLVLSLIIEKSIGVDLEYVRVKLTYLSEMIISFDFSEKEFFWKNEFLIYALPIYLSDIMHSSVDMADSIRNGTPFCSYRHPPGFFRAIYFRFLK